MRVNKERLKAAMEAADRAELGGVPPHTAQQYRWLVYGDEVLSNP
eukprot:COSAG02_NODE_614_length_19515_cov_6.651937_1_plen_45_part_00